MPPAASEPRDVAAPGERDVREITATMNLALRIGELLLSSGAGASDVSAAMNNVARACGLRGYSADVMFTELTMSQQSSADRPALIQIRQVRYREVDYGDLTGVDHIIRDLVAGTIDRAEARSRLNRIISTGHERPPLVGDRGARRDGRRRRAAAGRELGRRAGGLGGRDARRHAAAADGPPAAS